MRKKKKESPNYKPNSNRIGYSTKKEEMNSAKLTLAEARRREAETSYTPVRINRNTTILVKRGKNIKKQTERYKNLME